MRIRRRHLVVLAVAAIGALAAAGAALALTNNSSSANFSFSPSTVPKKSFKSGKILVHTHTDFAKPADKAKGGFIKRVQVYFDNDFKFNTGAAPICNKNLANTNEAQAMSLCGKALVGTGKAQATSTKNANIPGCVLAFNGPKNGSGKPTLILHSRFIMVNCSNPSSNSGGTVDAILTGALKPANKSGFGKVLDVNNIDYPAAAPEGLHRHREEGQLHSGQVPEQPVEGADQVHLLGQRPGAGHRERQGALHGRLRNGRARGCRQRGSLRARSARPSAIMALVLPSARWPSAARALHPACDFLAHLGVLLP